MSETGFRESEAGKIVRAIVIVLAAVFMILAAYVDYELGPTKIGFEPVTSMSITLTLFAMGIVLFIVAVGPDKFKPKSRTP